MSVLNYVAKGINQTLVTVAKVKAVGSNTMDKMMEEVIKTVEVLEGKVTEEEAAKIMTMIDEADGMYKMLKVSMYTKVLLEKYNVVVKKEEVKETGKERMARIIKKNGKYTA